MHREGRAPRAKTARRTRRGLAASRPDAELEKSVLVVEADPEVQSQMARALRGRGLRVVGTSSGGGALALVSQWNVDLILVSDDLPGRAGIEVTRLIREAHPEAQVVVMATTVEPEVREAAKRAGAVGCVPKPLHIDSLSRYLRTTNKAVASSPAVAE